MLVIPNNFINFIEAVILDIENKKKCAYINYKKQKNINRNDIFVKN